MKKLALIIAMVLGVNVFAQAQGSFFGRGSEAKNANASDVPLVPEEHNQRGDKDADAPLGGGVLVLMGLGAGYALIAKRQEQ